jgi:hypothetical protein
MTQSSWLAEFNRLCWRKFPQLMLAILVWWGIWEVFTKIMWVVLSGILAPSGSSEGN